MTVAVALFSSPVYVASSVPLPGAKADGSVRHNVADGGDVLVDQLAEAKVAVAATTRAGHYTVFQGGFYTDYFNRVYVIPAILSLIDPILFAANRFYLWNTKFNDVHVTSIDAVNNLGLTIDTSLPLLLRGIKLTTMNILVDDAAPNSETANYTFNLDDGSTALWQVDLLRTNLLVVTPQTPVTEVLKWKTAVDASRTGIEQRASLTQFARVEYQVDYLFMEDEDQRAVYEQFTTGLSSPLSYPIWTEEARLLENAVATQNTLALDTTVFDVQEGDQLYFLGADESRTESVKVSGIATDGMSVTLLAALVNAWSTEDRLYRVTTVAMQDKPSLGRGAYGYTEAKVTLRQMEFRALFSGPVSSAEITKDTTIGDRVLAGLVNTMSGIPIIHARPILDQDTTPIAFDWNFEIIDYDIGAFSMLTERKIAAVTYDRKFYSTTRIQKLFWNWLLNWMHGQRRPVWLPTWLDDVGPQIESFSGSTITTDSEEFATKYPLDDSHRGLWIAYGGGWIARRIIDIATNGQGQTIISLDQPVPDDFPPVGPYDVGFLVLARQATDQVQREWHPFFNFLSTSFVSTKDSPEIT